MTAPTPMPDDRHGMTQFVSFKLGDLLDLEAKHPDDAKAIRAVFADTDIHAMALHWYGHLYIAPLGATTHEGDGEPGPEWARVSRAKLHNRRKPTGEDD